MEVTQKVVESLGPNARDLLMTGFISQQDFAHAVTTNTVLSNFCRSHATLQAKVMELKYLPGMAIFASAGNSSFRFGVEGLYSSRLNEVIDFAARVDIPKWNASMKLDDKGVPTASYFHHLGPSKSALFAEIKKNLYTNSTIYAIGAAHIVVPLALNVKADSTGKVTV